ncbi:ATP synthase subunit I [Methylomagnum sp.]
MKRLFSAVRWILAAQVSVIALITLSCWIVWDWPMARSALLGGVTAFLPNLYFAARFGFSNPALTAKQIVRIFYLGETIKLITTALLFVLIFQLPDIRFLPLFTSFTLVLMVFWFALLVRGADYSE